MEKQLVLVKKDMEIIKADLSATLEGFRTDMAKRETRLILVMAGMITLAVAILGILIRWPAPPV
ncbi:MAG: hypothetical protein OXC68_09060 [Aestuariivita sp.]|nr:hypothetical protein [Aestuariivita sp.]